MTINQVYQQYRLMPNLVTHQLRVAGVAAVICDHLKLQLNKEDVILACLLHDMGNIIKFDLHVFPEFTQPEGIEHWQTIKDEYIKKYGPDEHEASMQIACELNVSQQVLTYIDAISFSKIAENLHSSDLGVKICAYADMRVTPFAVVSLQERLEDLEKRYASKYPGEADKKRRQESAQIYRQMESQIFSLTDITPTDVTNQAVDDKINSLRQFQLPE